MADTVNIPKSGITETAGIGAVASFVALVLCQLHVVCLSAETILLAFATGSFLLEVIKRWNAKRTAKEATTPKEEDKAGGVPSTTKTADTVMPVGKE